MELTSEILIGAHCRQGEHSTVKGMEKYRIGMRMEWVNEQNVLICTIFHCLISQSGARIQRPFTTDVHEQRPIKVVHMDFLYMCNTDTDLTYVLITWDDSIGYTWLCSSSDADSASAKYSVSEWMCAFYSMLCMVTCRRSYFTASLMKRLIDDHILYRRITSDCPWAAESIEQVCRKVPRACSSFSPEWHRPMWQLFSVIGCVQSILNQSTMEVLGIQDKNGRKKACMALGVSTGLKPTQVIALFSAISTLQEVQ